MRKSGFVSLIVVLVLMIVGVSSSAVPVPAKAQPANTPWPNFGHDPQHTGRSPYSGPDMPLLKWSYATGGPILSSPGIGADGTIYVGSGDKSLCAVNPDGTLKWSYATGGEVRSSPAIDADGTIYVGSYDGKLYAVNPNGTLK